MLSKLIKNIKDKQASNTKRRAEEARAKAEFAKDVFDELIQDEKVRAEMVKPKHWINQVIK